MKLKIVTKEDLKDWTKELFEEKSYNMIDVSDKKVTLRRALACGSIIVGSKVFDLIENQNMPKGDPISLAEVAGLLGVKKTSDLIPLCHPLSIEHSSIVNAALITIYDLSKIVNPDLSIEEIRLLVKQGGKSGLWLNPNGLPEFLSHLK